jgi:hypothetical protein
MRRNRKSITTSPEIVEHIDGLTNAQFNLLTGLIPWLAENEKRQRKYMSCVLIRLSKIETLLTELLGVELVQFWPPGRPPEGVSDERRAELVQEVEERISRASEQLGLKMIRYIYGETEMSEGHHDRRRKWWGWEI